MRLVLRQRFVVNRYVGAQLFASFGPILGRSLAGYQDGVSIFLSQVELEHLPEPLHAAECFQDSLQLRHRGCTILQFSDHDVIVRPLNS